MNRWQLDCKDVLEWCKEYTGPKFHAMLADPPYELHFMQKSWDNSGIAFQSETWAALSEHLLPGAFIFVFGSSRGWHRLAVAIEDAGFVFHPSLMVWGWVNGAGFPKATRVAASAKHCLGWRRLDRIGNWLLRKLRRAPRFGLSLIWEGHRYGRQSLKPAVEMIICAQKPYEGRPVDCIVETGAGALFIDRGRVGTTSAEREWQKATARPNQPTSGWGANFGTGLIAPAGFEPHLQGRWPPNFCLVHVPPHICATCDGDGCDECNDTGLVGGCRRVGTKQVKGSRIEKPCNYQGNAGLFGNDGARPARGIGDTDGYEETAAWQCCESCAARRINGVRKVDKSVILHYNVEKQEVNQCCEIASIAVLSSMLSHTTSGGDLADFAVGHALATAAASEERLTLGVNSISVTKDGIDSGARQEVARYIDNLKADGSGKWQTGQSPKDMTYTILIETSRIMTCPTCNLSLHLNITLCTNESEKITELSQTGQKLDAANAVININHSTGIISVQREHMAAIAKIVVLNTCVTGMPDTPTTARSTAANSGSDKNVSRFFPQFGWAAEIAERQAAADQVRYCAKASRSERDAGLEKMPLTTAPNPNYGKGGFKRPTDDPGREVSRAHNNHPTVKAISLCRWLATLLLPPPEYAPRRILVPFAGVASEMIAASLAGWEFVQGIETSEEYCKIGEARLAWWLRQLRLPGID